MERFTFSPGYPRGLPVISPPRGAPTVRFAHEGRRETSLVDPPAPAPMIHVEMAHLLAVAAIDGPWEPGAIAERWAAAFDLPPEPCARAARWLVAESPLPVTEVSVAALLTRGLVDLRRPWRYELADEDEWEPPEVDAALELALTPLARAWHAPRTRGVPRVRRWHMPPGPGFRPVAFAAGLPSIATEAALAAHLGLDLSELDFLTGPSSGPPPTEARTHYLYRVIPKASGALRLLEVPKARLRAVQRAVLRTILDHVPTHPAAHAFVRRRSARTFAAVHAGAEVVVRVDLEDFFASVGRARVEAIFAALGHPPVVASRLARLTCHRTPVALFRGLGGPSAFRTRRRFARPHLPQGAPTSPALANLAAFGLDVRLSALARRLDLDYARYADDLVLSGGRALFRERRAVLKAIVNIANDEGFAVRFDKTRVMPRASQQRVAGLVVNSGPDVSRAEYDQLRAELHAVATGRAVPGAADERAARLAELRGRVSWASARPHRAVKLARLLALAATRLS